MYFKKIATLLCFVLIFSTFALAQVEDGVSRSLSDKAYNYGNVKVLSDYKITIENPGNHLLIVGEIFVPKGVMVTVLKRKIKPGEKGIIVVTVDPKYMDEGPFVKKIKVTTYTQNDEGTRISLTKTYTIKGQVL